MPSTNSESSPSRRARRTPARSRQECELGHRQARVHEALLQYAGAESQADQPLVQVLGRPRHHAGVHGTIEGREHLRDVPRGGDDHDQNDLRLQCEHLDMADRGRVHRRRGYHSEQVRHLRERLRGRAHRLLDLAANQRELESPRRRRQHVLRAEQAIDDVAMAGVGGHTTGGYVGMREQPMLLQQRQFVAHRRGPAVKIPGFGDRARGDRRTGAQVVVDHLAQNALLTRAQHGCDCRRRAGAYNCAARGYSSSSASALRMICLPPCSATVSISAYPSASSRTVPLTTTSCSGTPMPRN